MKLTRQGNRLMVERQPGDDPVRKETAFWFRLRTALKREGREVRRYNPSRHHLTPDTHALLDVQEKEIIHDSDYALRDAAAYYREHGAILLSITKLEE